MGDRSRDRTGARPHFSSVIPWPNPIAALLSALLAAPTTTTPPTGQWSEDGSAEGTALRRRVEAHDDAKREQQLGTRGLVFVADPTTGATTPSSTPSAKGAPPSDRGPAVGPAVDVDGLTRQAEIERIVRKGRRMFIPGIVIATLGTLFTIGGIAGVATQATPASGGFLGAGAGLALIGWPIAIAGVRRRRHPERFLDRRVAAMPGGLVVRF